MRLVLLIALLSLVSCRHRSAGNYRPVYRNAAGGIVAIAAANDLKSREQATRYMAAQCAGAFDIVEEGEHVVGESTEYQGNTMYGYNQDSRYAKAKTRDEAEWRLRYVCRKDSAPAPTFNPTSLPPPPASQNSL